MFILYSVESDLLSAVISIHTILDSDCSSVWNKLYIHYGHPCGFASQNAVNDYNNIKDQHVSVSRLHRRHQYFNALYQLDIGEGKLMLRPIVLFIFNFFYDRDICKE